MSAKIKIFYIILMSITLTNCSQLVTYKAIEDEIRVIKAVHTVAKKHDQHTDSTTDED